MPTNPDFTIYTLGCGSAKPSVAHLPSCTVVEHRGTLYMIDCGEGAQRTFQQMHLKFSQLRHIFLTHLHGDHILGLPGLVSTLALQGNGGTLTIHTFKEGKEILDTMFNFFIHDLPFTIEWDILDPKKAQTILDTRSLTVTTVPLNHRVDCVGYIFREKAGPRHLRRDMADFHGVPVYLFNDIKAGADFTRDDGRVIPNEMLTKAPTPPRSYAHIGDTIYMPRLAESLKGIDLLFHETTYLEAHADKAKLHMHSTARQAAMVARDAGVGTLLTGHYSSRDKDPQLYAEEARDIFPNVIANTEGLSVPVLHR